MYLILHLILHLSIYLSIYLSYPILSYLILSYPILSYPIYPIYPILSYPILSYLILSYRIVSYLILSYRILSHLIYLSNLIYTVSIVLPFSTYVSIYLSICLSFHLSMKPEYLQLVHEYICRTCIKIRSQKLPPTLSKHHSAAKKTMIRCNDISSFHPWFHRVLATACIHVQAQWGHHVTHLSSYEPLTSRTIRERNPSKGGRMEELLIKYMSESW